MDAISYPEGQNETLRMVRSAIDALEATGPLVTTALCGMDVNGDGRVTVADIQELVAMAAAAAPVRCDLDGDGWLTKKDFDMLSRAVLMHATPMTDVEVSNSNRK